MTRWAGPLGEHLHGAALERGLIGAEERLTPELAFRLVRDMPYARADTHEPAGIIGGWRGTCSTKHELLQALLLEWGLQSRLIACTQLIRLPPGADMDPELKALAAGEPVVDVHNYLVVHTPHGDMTVDATWPLEAAAFGLPTNPEWVWGQDMQIGCTPLQSWDVPPEQTLTAFKDRLLAEQYTPAQLERRERFIRRVGELFLNP
ncbi:hypothetical protein [Deinococcus sonorensis]|uniref:Transglutaminase-like domain-containing protein n=2 Tax=Deinococcus sonorensis TaxID=309891 RepID=A0AAU7U8J0_9DEIO